MRPLESLFLVALVLYTTAIFSHRMRGTLKPWMMTVFGLGLLADISGTVFLCVLVSESWQWTLHSISGLAALLIMALHFTWAVVAVSRGGASERRFHRWSVAAWLVWLIAFVSGIPT